MRRDRLIAKMNHTTWSGQRISNYPKHKKITGNVGGLRYLAHCTITDLSSVVGRIGAAMAQPTAKHWKILNAKIRYLTAARNYGLFFRKNLGHQKRVEVSFKTRAIEDSSETDCATNSVNRKSITGGYLMHHGMPVGCISKKQTAESIYTAEAEYRKMTELIQRVVCIQKLATTFEQKETIIMLGNDDMSAWCIIKTSRATKRSKFK